MTGESHDKTYVSLAAMQALLSPLSELCHPLIPVNLIIDSLGYHK